jgi:DNA (cytosine-5)-methyltransferase 1
MIFKTLELFAGAGGMALGFEKAGFYVIALNEIDKDACKTLRANRPYCKIIAKDIAEVDFKPYNGLVDVVTGGLPCQPFSYAGKQLGFEDTRGTLFYEFARAITEISPKIAVIENVRGLLTHENGQTLATMIDVLGEIGYNVVKPIQVLKAVDYGVPQKRERLFIIAIRKGLDLEFMYPTPSTKVYTLKDVLKAGELYETDVPLSSGQVYSENKKKVLDLVPQGGYWRNLPLDIQKDYMKGSYFSGGGKTGIARRLSWDQPSLTLTCSPSQKQTDRCHPDETRPLTIREYARIQTFPDDWQFVGSVASQYKQIGNAVPVNLAYAVAKQVMEALNTNVAR